MNCECSLHMVIALKKVKNDDQVVGQEVDPLESNRLHSLQEFWLGTRRTGTRGIPC